MTTKAKHAINAAKNVNNWGYFAARQYCERRGVSMRLRLLAYNLEYGLI
jgi:hypothetical protein